MNISSLFNSSYLNANTPSISSGVHQFRKDFDQLGQDLQAGNLSAASTDFANLQKDAPQLSGSSSTQNANSFAQEMRQLSSDLQSGNLKAAQQDYTNLQQKLQSLGAQRPHHHHHTAEGAQSSNSLMQDFSQLGQNLQTGDLASAQKAYTSLQQDMQQFAIQNGAFNSLAQQISFSASA